MTDLRPPDRPPAARTPARAASVALALAAAACLFALVPPALGPFVTLSVPLALPVVLLAAVGLVVAAAVRERREAARRQESLLAEVRDQAERLRQANDQLRTQAAEILRQRDRLRENEGRLLGTLRAARMVAWDWDVLTGRVNLSGPVGDWVGSLPELPADTPDPLAPFVHPEDRSRVAAARARVAAGADGYEVEYRLVRTDGREVWVLSRGHRARGVDGGTPGRVTGVMIDVTARRASEERLRLLESAVVHAHDAVVVLEARPQATPGRRVLYVNDAFCRMTGYAREEVLGRSLHLLRGPDSDPATLGAIRRALDAGHPLQVELQNRRKDGAGYWVDLSLVPVLDPTGRIAHWVMIQRDVTDRKRAEEALRRSEERYRLLFDSNPHPMWVYDRQTLRFLAVNDAAVHKYGYAREEFLGMTARDVCPTGDVPRLLAGAGRPGYGPPDPARHRTKDGTLLDVEVSTYALTLDDRPAALALAIDVTERRRLEEQLRQAQKLEAIGQMAGGIAHDFNNLLTAVLGNLSLVKTPEGDANRPLLAAAEQAAVRAADLTRKLLGYARRNQLVPGPVDPREAFDEVAGLLGRTFDPRVRIAVRVDPGCGPVLADPTLLNQALINLCLNARDAMPDGGTLTLAAEPVEAVALPDGTSGAVRRDPAARPDGPRGEFVRLSVTDTGCGMTDQVKARIFEPFFTTKEVGKGTGLGLPMVQGIVRQHHGWVECESAPGAGTRIDLYLPPAAETAPPTRRAARADDTDLLAATPRPAALPGPRELPAPPEPGPADGGTVLLVDDEEMIRQLGRVVLERAGYRVITAEDGAEAVETFARERARVDLVILDVTMPRMSGRDAFRHMVRLDPDARILFSTGYSSEEIAELDGARGLLGKPYRPDDLLSAVRAALAGRPADLDTPEPAATG